MDSSSAGTNGLAGGGAASALAGVKKRTKVVFLNPVEIANWDQIKENSKQNVIDQNDLINYEKMLKDDDSTSVTANNSEARRQSKRRGRPKGSRNGARKRPIDPSQPWLESSDSDEPNVGLEDELDDDEYFRRLEEEKMREDAEEVSRKRREMEARAAARANAQGRRGSAKVDPLMTHQFQTPVNSDSNLSCQSGSQREFSNRNKKQRNYAALAGFREVSDSDDLSELDDKGAGRSGFLQESDYPRSLDDIHEQNEEDYQEPASPFRQSILDMLPPPPSPVIPSNSEEDKSSLKCESLSVASSNDLNALRTTVANASINDPHTQKMLEMDPIELRFRSPPLILPSSANDLVCPREYILDVLSIYEVLRRYGSLLRLSPFRLEDFAASLISDENSNLLAEAHMVLLKALLREDEANGTAMCPVDCRDSVNMTFYLLDRFTWPYLLANYLSSIKSTEAAARLSAANTTTAAGSIGGPTGSGGADIVLTAALFPPDLIPLNPDYPFVPIKSRIAVLRGLTSLFLATGPVRGDILREGLMTHEDYCRVCHQSGEVLCCDGCTAVFHLHCLNPPLSSVPTTSWICPVCIRKRTPGVTDCLSEAEKSGVAHYQEPIGKDRAGRLYWYISRRLIIEPVDFSQCEPQLMGFHDGVVDSSWEMEYGRELMEDDPEVKDDEDDIDDNNNDDNNNVNSTTDSANNDSLNLTSKVSYCDSSQPMPTFNKQKNYKKYQCNPSISYANEPCVYYYSSIEQVMYIRELLSTEWEPWLCYRLDALLPRMRNEMAITQKLTESGFLDFCSSRPNHKSVSINNSDSNQSCNLTADSPDTVYVYSVLEVERASFKKSTTSIKTHGETSDYPKTRLAIAASSLPSADVPIFPTLPKQLPALLNKQLSDLSASLIVTDENSCIVGNGDQVITHMVKETSDDDVATYPPTILEPQEISTLHMLIDPDWLPNSNECCLLAYRFSDEGNWRSWTNLYTSGVWTGEECTAMPDSHRNDDLSELKRTPSGTRNSNAVNNNNNNNGNNSTVTADDLISDSVNVALTRAQHMEEKERRRLLSNKFNVSELCTDMWAYIDPVELSNNFKLVRDMMASVIELPQFSDFDFTRYECWPASPHQLLNLLRLTLCHFESKIPLAFYTPAWRAHRTNWIKDVLHSKSPSDLAFLLARLEASIRSVCFQRVWFNSLGHLTLERMTASQREEDKRLRQFDRFSSTVNGGVGSSNINPANLPTNLIRTKTPRPVRHTVWKTRGEEYRRLGGDGWMWLSATRSNAGRMAEHAALIHPPISSGRQLELTATLSGNRLLLHRRGNPRGLQHGIGWGVCPEYLQDQMPVKPPKASECRGHVLHPITGIPLYLNPKRNPYIIPSDVLCSLNEQILKSSTNNVQVNSSSSSSHIDDDAKKKDPDSDNMITVNKYENNMNEDVMNDNFEKNKIDQLDGLHENCNASEIKIEQRKDSLSGQTSSINNNTNDGKIINDDNKNPVLNISYCISNRIHFPPPIDKEHSYPSSSSSLSSSKRLRFRIDNLLEHRYIAAENDKKASLAALNAVSKLESEIENLEKRHNEVVQRLTTLGTEAQQARTAKAQAVKAKQTALLIKPSQPSTLAVGGVGSGNVVMTNSRLIQLNENSNNTTNTTVTTFGGGKQLIQQSVLTDQGVRYRVLAPRTVPNIHMNQVAFNPVQKTASTPNNRTPQQTYRSNQKRRINRNSDLSESDSDSDSVTANTGRVNSWSARENVPLRRSARRVRAVRHDPDFVVDFDEDDDEDDRLNAKGDDSDNFDPNDEIQGSSKKYSSQRRSQVSIHLNARSTTRSLPQYDGVGDTTDEDIDEYDDEDAVDYDEEEEDIVGDYAYVDEDCDNDDDDGEYYYDNEELEEDEVVEEDEDDDDEYFPVFSRKHFHTESKNPEKSPVLSKVAAPCSTNSSKSDTVPVVPKVVILKNNTAPYIYGNTATTVKNKDNTNPRVLSIPPSTTTTGQRIILPAKLKTPTNTNEKSVSNNKTVSLGNVKEDTILSPTIEPLNVNQTVDNSIITNTTGQSDLVPSSSTTGLNSFDSSDIHLVLNSSSTTGSNNVTISKPSVILTTATTSCELKPAITNTPLVSISVENETSQQPITISTTNLQQCGIQLTDLITPATVSNTTVSIPALINQPATVNIATVGKLKPPSANSVRFIIAPTVCTTATTTSDSSGSTNPPSQTPTITIVKASNQSDVSSDPNAVTSAVTSSFTPILPRKPPPAILRRTLAAAGSGGPSSTSLILPVSSSSDYPQIVGTQQSSSLRTPSVASLVATNTARQLVCGGFNRYISTGPSIRPVISDSQGMSDLHQGRRSIAKAQHIRHNSLIDEDPRFIMNNKSKVLISDYKGLVRQFDSGPTAARLQTPIVDEATLALDHAVTEASSKLDAINAQIASVRSEAQELESQINSLKSELGKYQEIVNRGSPVISSPYSLSLRNNADFDLNNKTFVNKFLRNNNKKTTNQAGKDYGTTTDAMLPQSLPYVNDYAWPLPDSMSKDQCSSEQTQNMLLPKSSLFRINPHNLRLVILSAGRREIPGYDVEKKRLSQVNWLYPSSRPNFAECWRFRLNLANFALLLRTLWHCIRWDDIVVEPDKDICVHDSNGRPCFKKTLNIDDDDDDIDVSGVSGRYEDNKPYSVRRIVEIQPVDRFWLQANYKVRITTTYPTRSNSSRRRKATDPSNRGRSTRGPSLQDSPEPDESSSRRKGRRGGQRNAQGGKDPDYDPAVDEGWRVGVPCSNNSSRRQSRSNFRSYGRSSRGSFCDSDDDGDPEFCGGRRGLQSQRNEVSVEEKWMSEDAVFLWEISVFMNSLLPPKSNYPPISDSDVSKIDPNDKTSQYIISTRLASLPPDPSSSASTSATVTTTEVNKSLISPSNIEGYVEKNGFLYDGGQPNGFLLNSSSSRSRSTLASALQSGRMSVNSRSRSDDRSVSNNNSIPRPLSPNTLEAKARARSIAATNAARASVAARRARFERALLEQRVRSLKSQFCSRKRLIFNWAKSLADIAVNEIKGAQQISKADKFNENSSKKLEQSSTHPHHQTGEKLLTQKSRSNIVNQLNKSSSSSSTLIPKKKIGRPSKTKNDTTTTTTAITNKKNDVYHKRTKRKITPTFSSSSLSSKLLANNRIPRKSALNHEFIKLSKSYNQTTINQSPNRTNNKNRLTMKLSLKQSKKLLTNNNKDSDNDKNNNDDDDNTTTITTHSSCSTASTSPGLGDDYGNNICQQKSTASTKTSRSSGTKTKRLKHESTNSDASEHNYNITGSMKSPKSSSVGEGGSKRGSSSASGTGRSNKGGGRAKFSEKSDKNETQIESITNVLQDVSSNSSVYCVCKTPYNPSREYIGCDLCRDWFHFECVGLDPKDSDKLGDSWHCPDCKQAELKANEMLYCVCRTPYEPTRVYIACDGCDEWYHPECVGLTPEQAVNHTDTYLCPTCCQLSQHKTNTTTNTTTKSSAKSKKSKGSNNNHNAVTVVDQTGTTKTIYETNLTSDRIKKLINLIEEIKQHKMSWPFIHSPDPLKFPIARSLDDSFNLPSVIINLKTDVYKTLGDFSFDMNRLFTNSRLIYPKDTPEFNCTEIVEALFVQKMKQFKEENL
ncbi:unnamed protein product [Schistosoma mattheei]|uniref:Nucleosome-remodeling factor subunit BPTF n=1 Tax=Schistosoma mattheei TaxID=31246 RepID=A0AA85BZX5_9TREM|nr:unnamed protein product [Schistosoma mattheei]